MVNRYDIKLSKRVFLKRQRSQDININAASFFVFIVFVITFSADAICQKMPENGKSLEDYFHEYQNSNGVKFFYHREWLIDIHPENKLENLDLDVFLKEAFEGLPFQFLVYGKNIIIVRSDTTEKHNGNLSIDEKFIPDDKNYTISGSIHDANTGLAISGVTIWIDQLRSGAVTNSSGQFAVTLPSAKYTLETRHVGKANETVSILLRQDTVLNILLYDNFIQLSGVTITGESMDLNLSNPEMSIVEMNAHTMKLMPALLGEVDLIRSLTTLPGVTSVGEGAGGFNVRGGNADQNLILLDDCPVFNTAHLFGFVSAFNPDLIKNARLYKAAMPPAYGGRVSSVLDVITVEGNKRFATVTGGLGTISSRLTTTIPIIKDKTSILAGGRFAYPDWIMHSVRDVNVKNSSAKFFDVNGKLSHEINEMNNLVLSVYRSADKFKFAQDTVYSWQTLASSLVWNSIVAEKVLLKTVVFYSDYQYSIEGTKPLSEFETRFGISTYGVKSDLSYSLNLDNRLDFGLSTQRYNNQPGRLIPGANSSINARPSASEYALESSAYVGFESRLNQAITLTGGFRLSHYNLLGPDDVFVYQPVSPRSELTITDTVRFRSGQSVKQYWGLEPRISGKISLNQSSSIKLSYNRTMQYVHLISNTTTINPVDQWQLSGPYLAPQIGNQFALGYVRMFEKLGLETSVETYYKIVDHVPEYKDGAELFINPTLETELVPATGVAYGTELYVRKNAGRLKGWVSYTYSRSLRRVESSPTEVINSGKAYPSNFDKPHNLTLVANYEITRRLSLSANFTYNTGRPTTYPTAIYMMDNKPVSYFKSRNNARIPDYHRLDLSITLNESLRRSKKFKGSWTFALMNVYSRKNAYSVFFKPDPTGRQIRAYRLSVIGTVIPALTYNFKF